MRMSEFFLFIKKIPKQSHTIATGYNIFNVYTSTLLYFIILSPIELLSRHPKVLILMVYSLVTDDISITGDISNTGDISLASVKRDIVDTFK